MVKGMKIEALKHMLMLLLFFFIEKLSLNKLLTQSKSDSRYSTRSGSIMNTKTYNLTWLCYASCFGFIC